MLTGLLTLIPVDEGGGGGPRECARVAVACALAGLSLAVGEVVRPYRDPWMRWVYRGVSSFLFFYFFFLIHLPRNQEEKLAICAHTLL